MGNKTFLEKLSDKIWKTKKARFAAAKRMERYYYFSNVSMALTSVSIVGVNLLPFLDGCSNKSSLITILTIIVSVYVLVISLLSTQARQNIMTYCNYILKKIELLILKKKKSL